MEMSRRTHSHFKEDTLTFPSGLQQSHPAAVTLQEGRRALRGAGASSFIIHGTEGFPFSPGEPCGATAEFKFLKLSSPGP